MNGWDWSDSTSLPEWSRMTDREFALRIWVERVARAAEARRLLAASDPSAWDQEAVVRMLDATLKGVARPSTWRPNSTMAAPLTDPSLWTDWKARAARNDS